MNLWVRSNTYTCVVRLQNDCNNNLLLFHYYTILEDGGNYKLNKQNMLEHYTIKNTEMAALIDPNFCFLHVAIIVS